MSKFLVLLSFIFFGTIAIASPDAKAPPQVFSFEFSVKGFDSNGRTAKQNYELGLASWCQKKLPRPGDKVEWVVSNVIHESPTSVKVQGCWRAVGQ